MSGHRPFAELRTNDPERRAQIESATRAMSLGLRLRDLRKDGGLSQVELATRMGISQEAVSKIELGDDTRVSTIERYVTALGAQVRILVDTPGRGTTELMVATP